MDYSFWPVCLCHFLCYCQCWESSRFSDVLPETFPLLNPFHLIATAPRSSDDLFPGLVRRRRRRRDHPGEASGKARSRGPGRDPDAPDLPLADQQGAVEGSPMSQLKEELVELQIALRG